MADINPRLNSEFFNLKNIYLGMEVLNYVDELDEAEKNYFYIRCCEFLSVSCLKIQKRFDFRDALLWVIFTPQHLLFTTHLPG
jgi:hypothetical protein